jgi:hypothetical protein
MEGKAEVVQNVDNLKAVTILRHNNQQVVKRAEVSLNVYFKGATRPLLELFVIFLGLLTQVRIYLVSNRPVLLCVRQYASGFFLEPFHGLDVVYVIY